MRTRTTITGILSGAALGLGLLASAPSAHAIQDSSGATRAEVETGFDCDGTTGEASLRTTGDDGTEWGHGPGTQGRSNRDPDGDANGGADKPGCDGGFDDDRDGNNGCGNDADFEDDNNGRCGAGPATSGDGDEEDGPSAEVAATAAGFNTRVAAGTAPAGAAPAGATASGTTAAPAEDGPAAGEPRTEVLGVTEERPDSLPRTGAGLGALTAAAGLCLGGGRLAGAVRRLLGS